jgi:hypothetical protein
MPGEISEFRPATCGRTALRGALFVWPLGRVGRPAPLELRVE